MLITGILMVYVSFIFINRQIYFQMQKLDETTYPNAAAIMACFIGPIGFLALLFILFMVWYEINENNTGGGFFKLKRK
jgi:uncharacterized membrane protein